MTLLEFKTSANKIAEVYGIDKRNVTVMASVFGNHSKEVLSYTCQAWIIKQNKHIRTDIVIDNPKSALELFKDLLELNFKEYSSKEQDIKL
jgi:hypothetical protein